MLLSSSGDLTFPLVKSPHMPHRAPTGGGANVDRCISGRVGGGGGGGGDLTVYYLPTN